ncbi:heterogeneous nuclear ribonucleoprotein A2 homolog 1 [Bicyclus anynana]|uniref:Heterogeneous nuclear ribonucleoprotein A2 homolog 1 n=1 Tax=Bicyclus anynana TaxID=110368 RepID=A0A6J1NSM6_BICAN|nr:heterogeneous nuclear ribonucleoprotein A2 homolog 1 [Bicyclus anynana]
MKYHIFLGLFAVAAAYPGIIHQEVPQIAEKFDQGVIGESGHHHHVQHEHAKSHQSIKFEHFHPVPVYVKKEHSHLLKHPLEKGKSEQNLKQIHPEAQHSHGGGLVLEDHRLDTEQFAASLGHGGFEQGGLGHGGFEQGSIGHGGFEQGSLEHGGLSQGAPEHGGQQGGYEQGGYEQFAGSYEGGEGLKAYAEQQPEIQGQYYSEHTQALGAESGEGYKFEHYN